uniref:Uncharacterized protein n=1 Tax=Amphimedon queenslandica TaxID=400682 RepID=A0A1X7TLA2_AMPQE
ANQALRKREVGDVETWIHCFLIFVAAKVDDPLTRELMAYGQFILMLSRKHRVKGRRYTTPISGTLLGVGYPLRWTKLNASMIAADVFQTGGMVCPLCQSHDHRKEDCAL